MQVLTLVLDDAGQEVKLPPEGKFAQWFAARVTDAGLTLKDVATECKISKQAVSQWINGHTSPSLERQAFLVKFFENRGKGHRRRRRAPAVMRPAPVAAPEAANRQTEALDEVDRILLPHAR